MAPIGNHSFRATGITAYLAQSRHAGARPVNGDDQHYRTRPSPPTRRLCAPEGGSSGRGGGRLCRESPPFVLAPREGSALSPPAAAAAHEALASGMEADRPIPLAESVHDSPAPKADARSTHRTQDCGRGHRRLQTEGQRGVEQITDVRKRCAVPCTKPGPKGTHTILSVARDLCSTSS